MKVGDLVRTVFQKSRTGVITEGPYKVTIAGVRQVDHVNILWSTGTHETEYNALYLEVINESR
jgi:hypothetical protein